jgi:hypothetical protein
MEHNLGNTVKTPGEPSTPVENRFTGSDLAAWIAEQDDRLATAFNTLNENPPTVFNSSLEILEAIREAARLSGRREVLDDLKFEYSRRHKHDETDPNDATYYNYIKSSQEFYAEDQDND